jgi:hypothetical protein
VRVDVLPADPAWLRPAPSRLARALRVGVWAGFGIGAGCLAALAWGRWA